MTNKEALALAQKKWGKKAMIDARVCKPLPPRKNGQTCTQHAHAPGCKGGEGSFYVGAVLGTGSFAAFMVHGSGYSWEQAFQKAGVAMPEASAS